MDIVSVIVIIIVVYLLFGGYEHFDITNTTFEPLGAPRYGLRGEKLNTRALDDCYFDKYKCYTSSFIDENKRYYGQIYNC